MTTIDSLLEAFTEAVEDYHRTKHQMFQREADQHADSLINTHGVDPEMLDDIYFGIIDA